MKLTEEQFCKMVQEFEGEPINKIKQIAWRKFSGEELKEFVEHCFKFNNVVLANVSKSLPERKGRCCGRCDGVHDLCFSDMTCDVHSVLGCEDCYGKR
jgi:hypothetical protein